MCIRDSFNTMQHNSIVIFFRAYIKTFISIFKHLLICFTILHIIKQF